jgi:hypothetical protein
MEQLVPLVSEELKVVKRSSVQVLLEVPAVLAALEAAGEAVAQQVVGAVLERAESWAQIVRVLMAEQRQVLWLEKEAAAELEAVRKQELEQEKGFSLEAVKESEVALVMETLLGLHPCYQPRRLNSALQSALLVPAVEQLAAVPAVRPD